jgi:hypothetical protein
MMLTAPLKHLRHHRFLADMLVADVLDRDSRSRGQRRRLLAHLVTQRFGKLRVIEEAHVIGVEKFRHPIGVANRGQRSGDHHPVVARQHPGNPVVVAFQQCAAHGTLACCGIGRGCYTLFGSGFAGLGRKGWAAAAHKAKDPRRRIGARKKSGTAHGFAPLTRKSPVRKMPTRYVSHGPAASARHHIDHLTAFDIAN